MKIVRSVIALRFMVFSIIGNLSHSIDSNDLNETATEILLEIEEELNYTEKSTENNVNIVSDPQEMLIQDYSNDYLSLNLSGSEEDIADLGNNNLFVEDSENDLDNVEKVENLDNEYKAFNNNLFLDILPQNDLLKDFTMTGLNIKKDIPLNSDLKNDGNLNNEKSPNLIISEVFYDGSDEWIEIFNIGDGDFLGDIEISGAFRGNKNQIYSNIYIPTNDFLIIANSDKIFDFSSTTSGNVNILINSGKYSKFSIPDTKEIQISLSYSGDVVDSFSVHEYWVKKLDNEKMSFHKVISPDGLIVTRAFFSEDEDRKNIIPGLGIIATPGILISTTEKVKDYSKDPNSQQDEFAANCGDVVDDIITISEIFRGGERYNPFIEFSVHEDIQYEYDSLLLSGSLLKQPLTINLNEETESYDQTKLQKNTKLILTTKAGELTEAGLITIVLHPDFSFNSFGGELELFGINGQNRQVLDIVKIATGSIEKSTYHAGYTHSCGDIMDNMMDFSPGFDESALKYFSTTSKFNEKIVEITKYSGGGGGCSCPTKLELCGNEIGNAVETGNLVSSGTDEKDSENIEELDYSGYISTGQIKIVSLEPKNPESITLQSNLPYNVDFKNHDYYLKTSTSNSKKYIDGILYSNTVETFYKNFGFLDSGSCVYLYSGDSMLDSYCYSSGTQQSEKEKKEEKPGTFNPLDYQISIIHIDYDPEGSDTGKETITIQSNSSKSLDLSKIKMKINATNKKLTGILEPNSSITLKGTFGFPNSTKDGSDVIVILFYDNNVFSTYTYNPNKPKIEIPEGAVKVYSVIDGDTFRFRKEDGTLQSVRLLGVDAPESNTARYRSTECFGKESKNYLTNLIKNKYVKLEFDPNSASSDAYGRLLAYVYLDSKLVNELLISEGYAKEYTYKSDYIYQSSFRKAQETAKKSEKGLRSSAICGKSIEEEPEAWGVDYEKLSIKISSVIYDPDGPDAGNEIVELAVDNGQISSLSMLDFSDGFNLTIFPRSEYSTGTTKTKKLDSFGMFDISSSQTITLKGDFSLPNTRATCVSIKQGNYTFDTRCYHPNQTFSEETILETGSFIPNVKIKSILPNPSGSDGGKEEIILLRTVSDGFNDFDNLNLNPDFSLLINSKTKKKLEGSLIPNQENMIKGSFSLPNSASCVSLLYLGQEIDKFCYTKAKDGERFYSNNSSVYEIPSEELSIIKKINLVKQGDKLCISYNKIQFSCKKIPNSTTEKNSKLLSMQNSYITQLENYIKTNYSMLYYDSDLKAYFDLYSIAKKSIKSGNSDFTRKDTNISVSDISALFPSIYQQDVKNYFISQIQETIPNEINLALLRLRDKYTESLTEKSDLSFLSFCE